MFGFELIDCTTNLYGYNIEVIEVARICRILVQIITVFSYKL